MKSLLVSWQFWALLSACFAALTAIFAKVGVENVNSDYATFVRTIVILGALGGILFAVTELVYRRRGGADVAHEVGAKA